jgi:uncharacterized membrane protein
VTPARLAAARLWLAAVGAAWGAGAAGLLVGHLRPADPVAMLAIGAVAAGGWALLRPRWTALDHPVAAVLAAVAGVLMARLPEPTFFLLVPLVAAAVGWPVGTADPEEKSAPRWALPATFVLGALVFFIQSANRHWGFASGAKDLGLFYQTHWLIAHGLAPVNTVMGLHALADHMELLDYAVAPLLWIHESAVTLLLVQAVAVASAVLPLAWLGARLLGSDASGLVLAWAWLLAPDLHLGVMFDYNPTQLGAAGLIWTAWALVCRGAAAAVLAGLVTCLAKEDICLYVAVLALVLGLRGAGRRALYVAAVALALFAFEMTVLFPRFRAGGFRHWEYEELGETPSETAVAAVTRPDNAALVLVNHPQKRRSLLLPLTATGYVGLADPLSVLMQTPNWAERFLSTHRTRWWGYHYGTPAAATAVLGLLLGWHRLRRAGRAAPGLPRYVLACAILAGAVPPYRTPGGNRRSDLYFFRQPYASAPDDMRTQRAAVRFVGKDPRLKVAAQYNLLPHLAGRPAIFMLDGAAEADVIALQLNGGTWPDGRPSWKRRLREIAGSGAFGVAFCQGQTVVLRRAVPNSPCPAWDALVAAPQPARP